MKRKTLTTVEWLFRDVQEAYPEQNPEMFKQRISSPEDIYKMFSWLFKNLTHEQFVVIWLNCRNAVIGFEVITKGILDASLVHPREVFRGAIVNTAKSIVLAHNHPSGNPAPSSQDIAITRKLIEVGKIIEIPVTDHIIFAGEQFTSFMETNLI